ncbi:hypothetical protein OPT61_g4473 [Boeremia exigua]|uniref:Uncharacterized protein n=1 Tax=Boeremia exigua TaxID=749465 RepID=A0ACC2IE31_9PLEO|nr:hypothetical protein OPT61_g4473 [Boeremia exigua]
MALFSLPSELKLNIIEHLDPLPTLQFALTNKEHSRLCKDTLREHAMFAKYSIIKPGEDGTFMWDFTKEILQDPRKGWYVRELNLIADRPNVNEDMSEDDRALFTIAVQELLPSYPQDTGFFAAEDGALRELGDALDNSLAHGYEDAIIVILLHHLPQLRILRMTDTQGGDCLMIFMRRVAAGYQNPALAHKMPLQHLENVGVAHGDTEFTCSIDWAVYFMCIPSLRTLTAAMMGSEDVGGSSTDDDSENNAGSEAHLRNTVGAPVSNIEELLFYECRFDTQSFNTILPMIKNLKRFCYHAGDCDISYEDYKPRAVINTLANYASHSLQELQLVDCEIGLKEAETDFPFVSVRDLSKLKALRCETQWLQRSSKPSIGDGAPLSQGIYSAVKDPRDNLPGSLEYLYLDTGYESENWAVLCNMFQENNANTPNLTLENVCLQSTIDNEGLMWIVGEPTVGKAVKPDVRFGTQHRDEMWKGLELPY